jgi:membrane-bound serine protease (ClpP class)
MRGRLTTARLIIAVVSTSAEEVAIWVIWRWLLPDFGINLPVGVLVGIMVVWAAFCTWLFIFTTVVLHKQKPVGLPSMVGAVGKVARRLSPSGQVSIRGELWQATSNKGDIEVGEEIVVVGESGLKLLVRKAGVNPVIH